MFAPKLEEIEILQTWNEELVARSVENGGDMIELLAKAAQEFDELLNQPRQGGRSLREMLEGDRAGEAQRLIAREIRDRRAG